MEKKGFLFVLFFLLLQPFLDLCAGIGIPFIHILIRGLFVIYCIFYLVRNRKNLPLSFLLAIMMAIYFISYLFIYQYSFYSSLSYTLKLFYLPITLLFFYYYENKVKEKYIVAVLCTYIGIFLLCYVLGLGHEVYQEGVEKVGFQGLFNSINELSAILIVLLPLSFHALQTNKKYLSCVILMIFIFLVSMLTGTKVVLLGSILTLFFFLYQPFLRFFKKQSVMRKTVVVFLILLFTGLGSFLLSHTTAFKNAMVQKNFFEVRHVFSLEGINKVVFNDRFSFIPENQESYERSPFYQKLLGVKEAEKIKDVEIDLFDIFYQYGLLGLVFIVFILIYFGYQSRLQGVYLFSYLLLFLISETSGHVLIYPAVCLYFGIILSLNQQKRGC